MRKEYSPEFPLGINDSLREPAINRYISFEELAEITRTGIFTIEDGSRFRLPDIKENKPLFTYKGNYTTHRSKDNLKERSPYVGVDIDIDEKTGGLSKNNLTEEQRKKVNDDIEILLIGLSNFTKEFFFCKRSSSGCGLHIFIKLTDVPDGEIELYEKAIFLEFQKRIDTIGSTNYKYTVDKAMLSASQGLLINHDPNVIFNPYRTTPASFYTLKPEYGEGMVTDDEKAFAIRDANDVDRRMFLRFEKFIASNKIRMQYEDIRNLAYIYFQLWPAGSLEDFCKIFTGFNAERARVKSENNLKFLKGLYNNTKKSTTREYKGKRITVASLYFIMTTEFKYKYAAELELHFNGYLSSVEEQLRQAFEKHDKVLLEAPTGAGKTYLMFVHLKRLAELNPDKNFVIALPYTIMAEQFAAENRDQKFKIKVHHGTSKKEFTGSVQLPDFLENAYKKEESLHEVFSQNEDGFIENSADVLERANPIHRKVFKKHDVKKKKKLKKSKKKLPEPLFDTVKISNNIWCTTYDSARQIKNIHTLIIDEAHDLVKQIGFRDIALKELDNVDCQKKIYITATPDALLPEVEEFYHIKCVKDDAIKLPLSIVKVKGAVTDALKKSIRETETSLSFYNNKPHCKQMQSDLKDVGIDAQLYNSDTKKEPHQIRLQQESILTSRALATCYLLEGINVLNPDIERINICGNYDISDIRQGAARPRKCRPEIKLLIKETDYTPGGAWRFNRAYMYSKRFSELQKLADTLNELAKNITGDSNSNQFMAYNEDMALIYKQPDDRGGNSYLYVVDTASLKSEINTRYMYWLYHKQRELWLAELAQYFIVGETTLVENDLKDPKRVALNFEVFKNAGQELITKFEKHRLSAGKRNSKLHYDEEMRAFMKEHDRLQFTSSWIKWTEKYFKMLAYDVVDFDTIKSPQKFFYWQKQADFAVSVIEGGQTGKEKLVAIKNKAVVDFLLSIDLKDKKYTTDVIFQMLQRHLLSLNMRKLKHQKQFFASLKYVLTIEEKQVRGYPRYVAEIIDVRANHPFFTSIKQTEEKRKKYEESDAGKKFMQMVSEF